MHDDLGPPTVDAWRLQAPKHFLKLDRQRRRVGRLIVEPDSRAGRDFEMRGRELVETLLLLVVELAVQKCSQIQPREMFEPRDAGQMWCQPAIQVLAERSEEHTSEIQSLMRLSYAVFCLKTTTQTRLPLSQRHCDS